MVGREEAMSKAPVSRRPGQRPDPGGVLLSDYALLPDFASLLVLAGLWIVAACGSGFLLALLARRVHPTLSLPRLWIFYSALMGFLVAVVLVVGWT